MTATSTGNLVSDWQQINQQMLMRRVAAVKDKLRLAAQLDQPPADSDDSTAADSAAIDVVPATDVVASNLVLSTFETDVLMLGAGVELDGEFAELCARAHGNPARTYPTFGLALAVLDNPHWDALTPEGALRRWRLLELAGDGPLTSAPLRIDETILHYLAGVQYHDERLGGLVNAVQSPSELPASHRAIAEDIGRRWAAASDPQFDEVVRLCGDDPVAHEAIAAAVCSNFGGKVESIDAGSIPTDQRELRNIARLCERAARLTGTAFILQCHGDAASEHAIQEFVDLVASVFFVSGSAPPRPIRRPGIRVDIERPTAGEQRLLWDSSLSRLSPELNGHLDRVVSQFSLGAGAIRSTCRTILSDPVLDEELLGADKLAGLVWRACRSEARRSLDELAQPICSSSTWPDLVLPDAQKQTLRDMAAQVRHRATVYERWGFAEHSRRGLGITALFTGASGTGKTLGAEVIANELELDLYRVDLSQVVSKYIGETEKNLRKVFDAAEQGGSVLLFDEADGLFGKRSDVKDSHDRYANLEVSYLLQRMETYRGLAILTTNLKGSIDLAFQRRLRFIVQFPFPDVDQRREIWQRVFPADTPLAELDCDQLAKLNVTGGTIRNIALQAAFAAADAGAAVTMNDLLRATHREYAKLEKSLATSEIRGWVETGVG